MELFKSIKNIRVAFLTSLIIIMSAIPAYHSAFAKGNKPWSDRFRKGFSFGKAVRDYEYIVYSMYEVVKLQRVENNGQTPTLTAIYTKAIFAGDRDKGLIEEYNISLHNKGHGFVMSLGETSEELCDIFSTSYTKNFKFVPKNIQNRAKIKVKKMFINGVLITEKLDLEQLDYICEGFDNTKSYKNTVLLISEFY